MPTPAAIPAPSPDLPVSDCPRCGYDLDGIIRTWTDACPLTGECSECGLRFAWRQVLRPELEAGAHHIEGATSRLISAGLRTALMLARAGAFWRWTRMEWPVRWVRLTMLVLITSAAILLITGGLMLANNMIYFHRVTQVPWGRVLQSYAFDWGHHMIVVWPFGTTDTGSTIGMIRWRWHPLSAWSTASLVAYAIGPSVLILAPWTRRAFKVRLVHVLRIGAYGLVPVVVLFQSRMLLWHLVMFFAGRHWPAATQAQRLLWRLLEIEYEYGAVTWFALTVLLTWWWWRAACRYYLRLPQPELVAAAIAIVGGLGSITMCVFVLDLGGRLLNDLGRG